MASERERFVPRDQVPGKGQLRWGYTESARPVLFDAPRLEDNVELEMFPEEVSAFHDLKQKYGDLCSHFTDRFIACALLQWYLDIDQAALVLKNNLEFKKRMGLHLPSHYPLLDDKRSKFLLNFVYSVPGARSKAGHAVFYGKIKDVEYPPGLSEEDAVWASLFTCMYVMESERLDACRMGILFVADLEELSWRHWSREVEKAASAVYQSSFPVRVTQMALSNAPLVLSAILPILRVYVKEKVMDRIQTVESQQVLNLIDKGVVPESMGGKMKWTPEDYRQYLRRWEKKYAYHRDENIQVKSLPSLFHPGLALTKTAYSCCRPPPPPGRASRRQQPPKSPQNSESSQNSNAAPPQNATAPPPPTRSNTKAPPPLARTRVPNSNSPSPSPSLSPSPPPPSNSPSPSPHPHSPHPHSPHPHSPSPSPPPHSPSHFSSPLSSSPSSPLLTPSPPPPTSSSSSLSPSPSPTPSPSPSPSHPSSITNTFLREKGCVCAGCWRRIEVVELEKSSLVFEEGEEETDAIYFERMKCLCVDQSGKPWRGPDSRAVELEDGEICDDEFDD